MSAALSPFDAAGDRRLALADIAPGFHARLLAVLRHLAGPGEAGWQSRASRALGVFPPVVSMWVNRDRTPNAASLAAISLAAGVSLDWLVFGRGPIAAPGAVCRLRAEAAGAGGAS